MRKILIFDFLLALLSGCAQKPESVLDDYFKALKLAGSTFFDQEKEDRFFSSSTQFDNFDFAMDSDGGSSEYSEKLGEELLKLVQKFEHKIIYTKMADDNNAIVSVENHHISD